MPRPIPTEVVHIPEHGGAWSRRTTPTVKGARVLAADWSADGGVSVLLQDGVPLESWSQTVVPSPPRRGRVYGGPRSHPVTDSEALAVLGQTITELAEGEVEAAVAQHRAPIVELGDWDAHISDARRAVLRWMLERQCMRDAYERAVRSLSGAAGDDV